MRETERGIPDILGMPQHIGTHQDALERSQQRRISAE